MARWDEYFNKGFQQSFGTAQETNFKKWQQQQEDATKREQFNQLKQVYGQPQIGEDSNGDPVYGFGQMYKGSTGGRARFVNDTPLDQYTRASGLRKEFIDRPEVKEYVTINTQVKSMDSLLNSAKAGNIKNRVSLDQALITMFNKLTDPTSVVRESEYARTPQNLPVVNRFVGAIEKVNRGGAGLTNSDREALVWGAKVIADERGNTFNQRYNMYKGLSSEAKVKTSSVLGDFSEHKPYFGKVEDKYGLSSQSDEELMKRLEKITGKK